MLPAQPMTPPPPGDSMPMGKVDRWIVNYFTMATLLYAITGTLLYKLVLGRGIMVTAGVLITVLMLKALVVHQPPVERTGRGVFFIGVVVMVAAFNTVVSWLPMETAMRWIAWLAMIISVTRIVRAAEGGWVQGLIHRLPYLFFFLYICFVIQARRYGDDMGIVRSNMHMSGLYANLVLAAGLFAPKLWQRVFWMFVGGAGVYLSGAGGALFTVPITFIPYILYSATSMPVKGAVIATVLIAGSLVFFQSQLFGRFLDIKLGITPDQERSFSGLDRLQRSKEVRMALALYGLQLAKENPFGTGLGHTYYDVSEEDTGVGHVHNGTVSTFIELGYPGFAVFILIMCYMFWTILRNPLIHYSVKGFYFTFFFTIFGRSLAENYMVFDLGNFFNLVFLTMSSYLFLHQKRLVAGRAPMNIVRPLTIGPANRRPRPPLPAPMPPPLPAR